MTQVVNQILGNGPLGAIIVAAGVWVWKQQKKLEEIQEKRVEEAMKCAKALHHIANIYEDADDVSVQPKE